MSQEPGLPSGPGAGLGEAGASLRDTRQAVVEAMRARAARHGLDHGAASWARREQYLGGKRRKAAEDSESDGAIELDEIRRAEERLHTGGGGFIDPALLEGDSDESEGENGGLAARGGRYTAAGLLEELLDARAKLGLLLPALEQVVAGGEEGSASREAYPCQLLKAKLVLLSYCLAELQRGAPSGGSGDSAAEHPCFSSLERLNRELDRAMGVLLGDGEGEKSERDERGESDGEDEGESGFVAPASGSAAREKSQARNAQRVVEARSVTGPKKARGSIAPGAAALPSVPSDASSSAPSGGELAESLSSEGRGEGDSESDSVSLGDVDIAGALEQEESLRRARAEKAAADLLARTGSSRRPEGRVSGDTMPASLEDRVLMRREAAAAAQAKRPSPEAGGGRAGELSDSEEGALGSSAPPAPRTKSAPQGKVYDPNSDVLRAKPGEKELASRPELAGKRMATAEIVKGLPDLRRAKSKKKSTARKSIRRRYERAQGALHGIHGKPRDPEYAGYKGEKGGIDPRRSRSQKLGY